MDRFALFNAMVNGETVNLNGTTGIIQSIQMEDGSGFCFNVTIAIALRAPEWKESTKTVFVRCPRQ